MKKPVINELEAEIFKEIFDYILSGKLYCGDCKRPMVGESGTSSTKNVYYYYSCLTRRRRKQHCSLKSVDKQWLEDLVIHSTLSLLADKDTVHKISEALCKLHEEENRNSTTIKSLEAKRLNALKASKNLISAIEQGIITEQTKIRLKELEAEISGLDFDIEQEKQRSYTFLTPEIIESYLNSVICGDIQEIQVRKLIVNTFIREIVLDNDSLVISYNFTDTTDIKYRVSENTITEIQRQSSIKTAFNIFIRSYILAPLPPLLVQNQ